MIENGSAYGATVAARHLLQLLEACGVTPLEMREALDDALAELKRTPGLEKQVYAEAARAVGRLYFSP
jgi:hypothetical protein